jgi:drug/metabolite transporter (DMT)-like permease
MKQRQAYIYAILSVLCWSTVGSAFKISLRYLDFLNLLLFSSFTALCVLFATLLIRKKWKTLKATTRSGFVNSALLGFLNPFLYYVVLFRAYDLLRAQEAATLNYTWPLLLVLLSMPLLKQKISYLSILAILISFSGIIVISTHGDIIGFRLSNSVGVLLAIGSAFIWALYWIFNIKDKREDVTKLFLNFCFGFLYILLLVWLKHDFFRIPWQGYAGAIYVGFLEMGITFVLWMKALSLSETTAKVTNLIYLSPFLSLIFIHFFVGETIFLSSVVGLAMIIGGILVQQTLKS